MKKNVVQCCLATGWGGLEMVLCEYHAWLKQNHIETKVICLQESPLHKNLIARGFQNDLILIQPGWRKYLAAGRELKKLDSPELMILFHRQQGPKMLAFRRLQAEVTVICHTFFGVRKKDFVHRYLFSKVDRWIVLTETQKANLLATIAVRPEKIYVVPNGVDIQKFKPKTKPSEKSDFIHIALVARLDPQKGQDIAVQALGVLNSLDSGRKIQLHLIGEDTVDGKPFLPTLQNMILQRNLQEQILFEGYTEDIAQRIPEMDIVWMPSRQETFGRCILEAMACRIPVIASSGGGVKDIVKHESNGLLFESGSVEDLAFQTQRLLQDQNLGRHLVDTAWADVHEHYDSELVWRKLLKAD